MRTEASGGRRHQSPTLKLPSALTWSYLPPSKPRFAAASSRSFSLVTFG
jgi:hypothetical protein